jgi:hypothetical protein
MSPPLANLMAFRLDCRLRGLAKSANAVYTRYADDLAFSGGEEFSQVVERFSTHVAAVAIEEGFSVNHHKTRIQLQGARQRLAGIVVNREGISDFRAHLEGRVGFVEMINREKGLRLREIFKRIDWER